MLTTNTTFYNSPTVDNEVDMWQRLPPEIIVKIMTCTDPIAFGNMTKVCKRNVFLIANNNFLTYLQQQYSKTYKNKKFLANYSEKNIPLSSLQDDFIKFIETYSLVTKEELIKFKTYIKQSDYYGMQYSIAEMIQKSALSISLKSISTISLQNLSDTDNIFNKIIFTGFNYAYFYGSDEVIYRIDYIQNSTDSISNEIFNITSLNDHLTPNQWPLKKISLQQYGQTIILTIVTAHCYEKAIFLQKNNGTYYNITPKDHYENDNSDYTFDAKLIGVQKDKQGHNIFILHKNGIVVFYSIKYNLEKKCHEIIEENITDKKFGFHQVTISENNNLMIINCINANKELEAHIYRHNVKIDILNTSIIESKNILVNFYCHSEGNFFAIYNIDLKTTNIKYEFFNIDKNKSTKLYSHDNCNSITTYQDNYYNSDGNYFVIFFKNDNSQVVAEVIKFLPENKIKILYIPGDYITNNQSKNIFLTSNCKKITLYNIQKDKVVELSNIKNDLYRNFTFSPNSQLLACSTVHFTDNDEEVLILIYQIMELDSNNNIQIISKPTVIAKYTLRCYFVNSIKFHPDGTKLIIYSENTDENTCIEILELQLTPKIKVTSLIQK